MQSINDAEQLDINQQDEGFDHNSDPSTQSLITASESGKVLSNATLAQ
jgi:hypothetical protein